MISCTFFEWVISFIIFFTLVIWPLWLFIQQSFSWLRFSHINPWKLLTIIVLNFTLRFIPFLFIFWFWRNTLLFTFISSYSFHIHFLCDNFLIFLTQSLFIFTLFLLKLFKVPIFRQVLILWTVWILCRAEFIRLIFHSPI